MLFMFPVQGQWRQVSDAVRTKEQLAFMTADAMFTFPSENGMQKPSGVPKLCCKPMSWVFKRLDDEVKVTKRALNTGTSRAPLLLFGGIVVGWKRFLSGKSRHRNSDRHHFPLPRGCPGKTVTADRVLYNTVKKAVITWEFDPSDTKDAARGGGCQFSVPDRSTKHQPATSREPVPPTSLLNQAPCG